MSINRLRLVVVGLCFVVFSLRAKAAQQPEASKYFEQDVASSNPLRTEQAKELDAYILALRKDQSRFHALFQPDYSSALKFEASAQPFRKAFCASIGYPPPGDVPKESA